MLLTEKAIAKIKLNELEIDLKIDFKVIENLHYALKEEVILNYLKIEKNLDFLDLLGLLEDFNNEILSLFLNVACDCKYTIAEIDRELKTLKENEREGLLLILKSLIIDSLMFKSDEEEKEREDEDEKEEDERKFEKWFNYFYCIARDRLKLTLEEFYQSTPAQLKERIYRFNLEEKNILINVYCEVMNARNGATTEKKETIETTDMYDFIRRI